MMMMIPQTTTFPPLLPILLLLLFLLKSSHSLAPIRTVTIVGGTHGNEYTGVWCVKELEEPSSFFKKKISECFPSLTISTLIGNPEAHLANRRFIDTDLNREFTTEKLQSIQEQLKLKVNPNNKHNLPLESLRAQEINQLLGPKENPCQDVVVDLHTTTTNMGITIIIAEGDTLMGQAAAYVLHQCQQRQNNVKAQIILMPIPGRNNLPHLASVGKHEIQIEVGPVPQGVIRHDIVEQTKLAIEALLEFLEQYNNDNNQKDSDDDTTPVQKRIRDEWFPTGKVPCYCSAKPRPGQLSGKIQWPSADHNPNFPAYMIHKSIQDKDFNVLLKKGDPLFVNLKGDVIPYDGSFGDSVDLMFINEGGYYYASSGTGIAVAVATEYDLDTATAVI